MILVLSGNDLGRREEERGRLVRVEPEVLVPEDGHLGGDVPLGEVEVLGEDVQGALVEARALVRQGEQADALRVGQAVGDDAHAGVVHGELAQVGLVEEVGDLEFGDRSVRGCVSK